MQQCLRLGLHRPRQHGHRLQHVGQGVHTGGPPGLDLLQVSNQITCNKIYTRYQLDFSHIVQSPCAVKFVNKSPYNVSIRLIVQDLEGPTL